MIIAAMAGIRVFATGGIGGVHRGAQQSFDVSADLQELARTPVAVVCAGAKSILDLPLTLEYLETHGVPVVGYRTDSLPAFFTVDSDCSVDYRLDSRAGDRAGPDRQMGAWACTAAWWSPIRCRRRSRCRARASTRRSSRRCRRPRSASIGGKEVTPFLLARVSELTGGDSLATNIELVLNNARLASAIAVQFARLGGYDAAARQPGVSGDAAWSAHRESPDCGCTGAGLGS